MKEISNTEKILKENLKKVRINSGKTGYAIAKELKLQSGYYYRLEDPENHVQPRYETLEKIAALANIEVYQLFQPFLIL